MARLSLALPSLARCERPSAAPVRAWTLQPGCLAHGPEEKCGVVGRTDGIVMTLPAVLQSRQRTQRCRKASSSRAADKPDWACHSAEAFFFPVHQPDPPTFYCARSSEAHAPSNVEGPMLGSWSR